MKLYDNVIFNSKVLIMRGINVTCYLEVIIFHILINWLKTLSRKVKAQFSSPLSHPIIPIFHRTDPSLSTFGSSSYG